MIWGCMSASSTGILRFIDGTMNSEEYITTMKENMLPSAQKLHNGHFVYQQDNQRQQWNGFKIKTFLCCHGQPGVRI